MVGKHDKFVVVSRVDVSCRVTRWPGFGPCLAKVDVLVNTVQIFDTSATSCHQNTTIFLKGRTSCCQNTNDDYTSKTRVSCTRQARVWFSPCHFLEVIVSCLHDQMSDTCHTGTCQPCTKIAPNLNTPKSRELHAKTAPSQRQTPRLAGTGMTRVWHLVV